MIQWAIFSDEKAAREFIAQVDAMFGWPDAETTTYAEPVPVQGPKWAVKIKPWLAASIAGPRWRRPAAVSAVAGLLAAWKLTDKEPQALA